MQPLLFSVVNRPYKNHETRKLKSRNKKRKPMSLKTESSLLSVGCLTRGIDGNKEKGWSNKYPRYTYSCNAYIPIGSGPTTPKIHIAVCQF